MAQNTTPKLTVQRPDQNWGEITLVLTLIPEGWLEIDKHYSLELCFSIEKQPETVWRA